MHSCMYERQPILAMLELEAPDNMGNGMNKVLPGLYVGNYRDSKDTQQLDKFQITHIVAIHDSPRRLLPDKHYLCVMAADTPDQNLSQYFTVCNDFIHAARLREGNVLIHCLAGMSRSVTVAVAYIMTATNLSWKDALKVVRTGRAVANPNIGFQTQLQEFEMYRLAEERRRLRERFPSTALEQLDRTKCMTALDNYEELLQNKDICEGNCAKGEKCPTGTQITDVKEAPQKEEMKVQSNDSDEVPRRSITYTLSFAVQQWKTPKRKSIKNKEKDEATTMTTTENKNELITDKEVDRENKTQIDSESEEEICKNIDKGEVRKSKSHNELDNETTSEEDDDDRAAKKAEEPINGSLQRSASTVSGLGVRPRSSPAGLYSYTGSVPSSRVDLRDSDRGSAIYLGCSAPRTSTLSLASSRGSAGSSAPASPARTPPVSPRHGVRRSASLVKKQR
uniref:Dual specificity protein phosphatase 15 n=1 Tax=Glossina austeni TaxID=7395 RepID=A0A1A9UG79_GLOAU